VVTFWQQGEVRVEMQEREKKRFCVIGASLNLVNLHHPMVIKHGPYGPFVVPVHQSTRLKMYG
jgi:hypothetical protein